MSVRDRLQVGWQSVINWAKVRRMVGYGAVGATGIVVDLSVLEGLTLLGQHYLVAIALSYAAAVLWNFALHRQIVYHASGNVVRQFMRYLIIDFAAFAVRVGTVVLMVDVIHPFNALPYIPYPITAAVPASLVGIAIAFVIGFQGTDTLVFGRYVDDDL